MMGRDKVWSLTEDIKYGNITLRPRHLFRVSVSSTIIRTP